ncbi:MAG TPA: histidine kinase, partial [Saprospiraceae bacterium]|nr:histidine kinase [Saprospiraceae bacterium]
FIENETMWLATLGRGVMQARIVGNFTHGGDLELSVLKVNGGGSHNFVFQVMPKEGKEAWLATDGAGLAFTEKNRIQTLSRTPGEVPKTIYSTTHDRSGNIWFTTPDAGLIEYDTDKNSFNALSIDEGLRSLNVSAIISNPKGEILIVHNKGIDILIPEKRHFMYFDDEIGLQGALPVLNAVCKDASGNIWIGMRDKLVKYSAVREDLSIHPRTRIEHVSVNQSPIDFHTQAYFPARQNFFAFDYVGLWYTSPASVKYQYTLEGHDLNWKESGDHLAIYSNLKPGNYIFRVKASENKFFYDEPLAEYAFEISKPFWQTRWFIGLAVICVVLLVYLFIKNREQRLRRIEALNKENIESQFRALKAQINPHFLFNSFNTLITIIDENTENPNVPIEYVQKLADFYRSILQYREEEAISIPEEITLVKNYYYLLQKRYGENLILDVNIDGTQGFVPPLTLQMLVENAVKHNIISKSKPLTIRIRGNNNEYLVVENNVQKKISDAPSTRFGLQSIINRYEVISDKKVLVEETNNSFKVSIPIIKNMF